MAAACDARPSTSAPRRLLVRLLAGTIVPTVAALALFGFFAHEVARRALEDELGRRLGTAAAGAAATLLPEQLRAFGAGDEDSLTYANVRRRLEAARVRLGVRRVLAVTPELEARGDTAAALALGAHAYELDADRAEIARALAGTPTASPLFIGHDGVPYKRAYAAVGEPGDVAGLVAVEGNADYPAALAAFRRSMIRTGVRRAARRAGADGLAVAPRISRPVARLAQAAARLGRGDLDAPIPIETRDEIGVLAQTLEETRAALRARDERMQMMLAGIAHEVRNPLGGLELYAGLLRDALGDQPERLDEVARIEREVGHLKAVVNEFLEFARRPRPRLEAVALRPLFDEIRELTAVPGGATITVEAAGRARGSRRRGPAPARAAEPGPQRGGGGARRARPHPAPPSRASACASRCATTVRACRPTCARRSSRPSSRPAKKARGWAWRSCARSCATTAARSSFATPRAAEACLASSCRGPDGKSDA